MKSDDRRAMNWRTARRSSGGACVEVASAGAGQVAVRHSRRPDAEIIIYSAAEWAAFIDGAKNGEFDDLG